MNFNQIKERDQEYILPTYKRFDVCIEKGRGATCTGSDGISDGIAEAPSAICFAPSFSPEAIFSSPAFAVFSDVWLALS